MTLLKTRLQKLRANFAWLILLSAFAWSCIMVASQRIEEAKPDTITIRIGHWQLEAGIREAFDQLAADYRRDVNPNVVIIQDAIPETIYGQWISSQLLSGNAPDLVELGLGLPGHIWLAYKAKYFLPNNDIAGEPNPYNKGTELENVPLRMTYYDGMSSSYVQELQDYVGVPLSIVFADGDAIHAAARGASRSIRLTPPFHVSDEDAYLVLPEDIGGEIVDILRDGDAELLAEAMRDAMERANVGPADIDYINAHGTGTALNDRVETGAIRDVFGEDADRLMVSSTKSMIGHMMGAAGAVEAAIAALTCYHGVVPPTINYETPDPDCDLDYVPNEARSAPVRRAMSTSVGLGGHNSAIIFGKWEGA